ncbi:MAG: formate dehydrogenase accessory sulfurtransferase FdhD [Alphaproteobacteria bacterium]
MNQTSRVNIKKVTYPVQVTRVEKTVLKNEDDLVILEKPFFLDVKKVGLYTILCTPSDLKEMAVGFVFSEGLIESMDEIAFIEKEADDRIGITLSNPSKVKGRNMLVTSAGGAARVRDIENMLDSRQPVKKYLRAQATDLPCFVEDMLGLQEIFKKTGGTHAASIFDTGQGTVISFAEDLGRHNALDKAIGKMLLKGHMPEGCGVALSGRVSFEMVSKAARAQIELITAVSAPTSLAVQAAERWNITLCGFVRGDKATIYTHKERIYA